jgi:hypothetical protein
VAVVIRSAGEAGLQGLRTALSLSLGDQPAAVYLFGEGRELLGASPESEVARCLATLVDDVGTEVRVEAGAGLTTPAGIGRGSRARLLADAARANRQQVF